MAPQPHDDQLIDFVCMPRGGKILNPGPLYHNAPFLFSNLVLVAGSRVVGMARFDPENWLQLVERERVEWCFLVPTMMHRIWSLTPETRDAYDLSSLKCIVHMDQKMITALAETTVPTGPFVEPQEDWFRRSRLCARMAEHRLCAIGAYRERIAVLDAIRSQPATTKTCVTGAAMAADAASGAMLLRADGRVIGWHRSAQKHGRSS